jgi:sarcosine oxidase subunit gamma
MLESRNGVSRSHVLTPSIPDPKALASITPVEASTRFSLRLASKAAEAIGAAAGFQLGMPINTCRVSGERLVARLGPDEWLLLDPEANNKSLQRDIETMLTGYFYSLVDVGHRDVAIAVAGAHAREIVNGGCPLDLDDAAFPAGSATRTILGKSEIVLFRLGPERLHRIECARSFAPYVYGLLKEIARELETN